MTNPLFTLDDLRRILLAAAGQAEAGPVGPDTADTTFADLGYDSLALLETASKIEIELGVTLEDEAVAEAETPAQLVAMVNGLLTGQAAA
jgi:act minimal PKS acyl carrier protein